MSPEQRAAAATSTRQSTDWTANEGEEEGGHSDITSVSATSATENDDALYDDSEDAHSAYAPSYYYPNMKFYDAPIDMGGDGADKAASTRSLCVPDLGYVELSGRRYCKSYFMPNDEHELARLTLIHQVHLHAFDGELTTVNLDNPERILDIGTGIGEWAIRMGELYPDCEVIGTDISAIQETSVPPNVFFEIDDAEVPWERPHDYFDLVHLRHLTGAFKDIRYIYQQAYDCLKPGAWIENKDFFASSTDRGLFEETPMGFLGGLSSAALRILVTNGYAASQRAGRPWIDPNPLDPRALVEAGFVDVSLAEHVFPLMAEGVRGNAGKMFLIATVEGFEAVFLRLLTEQMGMDKDEVRDLCEHAATEVIEMTRDPVRSRQCSFKITILRGRKPYQDEDVGQEAAAPPPSSPIQAKSASSNSPSPNKKRKSRKRSKRHPARPKDVTIEENPRPSTLAEEADDLDDVKRQDISGSHA